MSGYPQPDLVGTQRATPARHRIRGGDVSRVDLFGETLICQHLLLLENLLGEADLHLYDGVLVHDAEFGTAVVQEKLLVVYLKGLSTLHIAHKATEEIWVQIGLADVLKSLILFGASLFEFGV